MSLRAATLAIVLAIALPGCESGTAGVDIPETGMYDDLPGDVPVQYDTVADEGFAWDPAPSDPGTDSEAAGDASLDETPAEVVGDAASEASHDLAQDDGPGDLATDAQAEAEADVPPACPRLPAPVDHVRKVVISHPYDADGKKADTWEVLDLSTDGVLTAGVATVALGNAPWGEMAFTPDGEVGIAAQDDGTLGVLRFDDAGAAHVVHAQFQGSFYAASVVIDPAGDVAWVLDSEWRDIGGGVYRVRIGCDGTLTDEGKVVPAKLPYAMAFLPGAADRVLLAAQDALDSAAHDDAHLLAWGETPSILAGADAFGDDEAIVASMAVTTDGKLALIGDNASYSGVGNRIAVVSVGDGTLAPVQVLTDFLDPFAIVTSPFGNAAIAVSGFGDAIFRLSQSDDPKAPFAVAGQLAYAGKKPALPANAVMVRAGKLTGLVLVSENNGVRRLRFEKDGSVTDLGVLSLGDGLDAIPGAIGLQP